MRAVRVVRHGSLRAEPWKNGGGETRQIACSPSGSSLNDFDWRLSSATVAQDGAFSVFEGIDRRLYLLEGAGLDLRFGSGTTCRVGPEGHIDFRGEDTVHGVLVDGPIVDFNIMVRRRTKRVHIEELTVTGAMTFALPWEVVAIFVRGGQVIIADTKLQLMPRTFDTVIMDEGHAPEISADGVAKIILIGFDPL